MQRGLTAVERITLDRQPPTVVCTFAADKRDRWDRKFSSCGSRIPYAPQRPCPECGTAQSRPNAPHPGEGSRVLDRDTAIIDSQTGEVVVAYVECAHSIATRLAQHLRSVKWDRDVLNNPSTTTRLSGVAVRHRTFGYAPPSYLRRRYGCSRSQFNADYPEAMNVLAEFCRTAEHVFRTLAEDVYERTAGAVLELIAPAWRIAGTPWTSGIINATAALPYHRDQANVPSSWSAMLGCRDQVSGGLLHLLDYDVYLPVRHGSITIFDGQSVTHGVTPMTIDHAAGWRYTCVTYAKQLMSHCCPDPAGEARRAALKATEAEDLRAAPTYKAGKKKRRQP